MGLKGDNTKQAILDSAQKLVLKKGFSGTSLDEIIEDAGITKGGFFYHFKGRSDLAVDLLIRYLQQDDKILSSLIEKASHYVDDPLQRVLVFLKLYTETAEEMEETHPGCLVATYTYEAQQFDPEVREMIKEGVDSWRKHYLSLLAPAAEAYELRSPFTVEKLADMLNTIVEGGILLTKIKANNSFLIEQMKGYISLVQLTFGEKRQAPTSTK